MVDRKIAAILCFLIFALSASALLADNGKACLAPLIQDPTPDGIFCSKEDVQAANNIAKFGGLFFFHSAFKKLSDLKDDEALKNLLSLFRGLFPDIKPEEISQELDTLYKKVTPAHREKLREVEKKVEIYTHALLLSERGEDFDRFEKSLPAEIRPDSHYIQMIKATWENGHNLHIIRKDIERVTGKSIDNFNHFFGVPCSRQTFNLFYDEWETLDPLTRQEIIRSFYERNEFPEIEKILNKKGGDISRDDFRRAYSMTSDDEDSMIGVERFSRDNSQLFHEKEPTPAQHMMGGPSGIFIGQTTGPYFLDWAGKVSAAATGAAFAGLIGSKIVLSGLTLAKLKTAVLTSIIFMGLQGWQDSYNFIAKDQEFPDRGNLLVRFGKNMLIAIGLGKLFQAANCISPSVPRVAVGAIGVPSAAAEFRQGNYITGTGYAVATAYGMTRGTQTAASQKPMVRSGEPQIARPHLLWRELARRNGETPSEPTLDGAKRAMSPGVDSASSGAAIIRVPHGTYRVVAARSTDGGGSSGIDKIRLMTPPETPFMIGNLALKLSPRLTPSLSGVRPTISNTPSNTSGAISGGAPALKFSSDIPVIPGLAFGDPVEEDDHEVIIEREDPSDPGSNVKRIIIVDKKKKDAAPSCGGEAFASATPAAAAESAKKEGDDGLDEKTLREIDDYLREITPPSTGDKIHDQLVEEVLHIRRQVIELRMKNPDLSTEDIYRKVDATPSLHTVEWMIPILEGAIARMKEDGLSAKLSSKDKELVGRYRSEAEETLKKANAILAAQKLSFAELHDLAFHYGRAAYYSSLKNYRVYNVKIFEYDLEKPDIFIKISRDLISFPTEVELDLSRMNSLNVVGASPLGLIPFDQKVMADGLPRGAFQFFDHDLSHAYQNFSNPHRPSDGTKASWELDKLKGRLWHKILEMPAGQEKDLLTLIFFYEGHESVSLNMILSPQFLPGFKEKYGKEAKGKNERDDEISYSIGNARTASEEIHKRLHDQGDLGEGIKNRDKITVEHIKNAYHKLNKLIQGVVNRPLGRKFANAFTTEEVLKNAGLSDAERYLAFKKTYEEKTGSPFISPDQRDKGELLYGYEEELEKALLHGHHKIGAGHPVFEVPRDFRKQKEAHLINALEYVGVPEEQIPDIIEIAIRGGFLGEAPAVEPSSDIPVIPHIASSPNETGDEIEIYDQNKKFTKEFIHFATQLAEAVSKNIRPSKPLPFTRNDLLSAFFVKVIPLVNENRLTNIKNRKYYFIMMQNLASDLIRRHMRHERLIAKIRTSFFVNGERDLPPMGGMSPSPSDILLKEEAITKIREAVRSLPPRQRECLTLALEGFSNEEIAERLQIPISTVRSNTFRARNTLQRILERQGIHVNRLPRREGND